METQTCVAIIPARGGSRGLPGKNLRLLAGEPLIAHSIRAAQATSSIHHCVVTTDCPEIARVAEQYGASVPMLRPPSLAADDTAMAPVVRHALEHMTGSGVYSEVVLLDPTSPVRELSALADAISLLRKSPHLDGVVSVSEPHFNPVWVGVKPSDSSDVLERYFEAGQGVTRRQELGRYLRINGSFYVWSDDFVRRLRHSWFDEGVHGMVETKETTSFSVDTLEDFQVLEALVASGVAALPQDKAMKLARAEEVVVS